MNNLTNALLGSVALCALATAPAMAQDVPDFHVTVLHAGNVVNKTVFHDPSRQHLTYTFAAYASIPAELDKTIKLGTLASWGCSSTAKARITRKANYGKAGIYTETYSANCSGAGEVFYGNTYKLTNPAGEGKTDTFVSTLIGKFEKSGVKYKGTLNMDVSVTID
jgi:hypothetical protein